ncbi:MAG: hypothetical protein HFI37_07855 [Lachnospiraceae bacterium]|nr:hypothetical protein [Lachnospiraceae bacterium]
MKKKLLLTMMVFALGLAVLGCSDKKKDDNTDDKAKVEENKETKKEEKKEEEKVYNVGDNFTFKDWGITISNTEVVDNITSGSIVFSPQTEGNKLFHVFLTATNNGKEKDVFLPTRVFNNDVYVEVIHGDEELKPTALLGYGSEMVGKSIEAQASEEGEITFEVPETVASSTDELLLRFKSGNDTVSVKVR